ncbi:class II aldolase/adducin family protein [Chachezhania antarctica]|uniref:class II aldolase/adducin family protein n=1 Tax=Chachezhania antarctica TaxID=2340860 RepID=UPI000EB5538B|nr:class II aldolase/adducin family protein [Chachezhania antarctica]|tara:strand:+ start:424 stop:1080 length:657 start_codon:yes stop_codon:yes gene_type:complete
MTRYTDTTETRQAIIDACRWMNDRGINQGTSGNISVRVPDAILITPSGVPYDRMTPEMIIRLPPEGEPDMGGDLRPSTEWRFHQRLLAARPDMSATVHAHPAHATAVAMQGRPIPACHYMIAAFGGNDVPITPYAMFGSSELAEHVAEAMRNRHGCLMTNHGATVVGESLDRALWRMEELENLARVDLLSRTAGEPVILSDAQIEEVIAAFSNYGPGK